MHIVILLVIALVGALGCSGAIYYFLNSKKDTFGGAVIGLKDALAAREKLKSKLDELYLQMVDVGMIQRKGKELLTLRESLKTERGRITITQAELETVESRLRELEEIERELAASRADTEEELKILTKKKNDLEGKNNALKEQISSSMGQLDEALKGLEMSSQMQEQIQSSKVDLLQTQEKIDLILIQIDQSNEQYFTIKKRYDALDIEYAQLYEKFQLTEEAQKEKV
jgi:chromosome segregation ATPase